MHHYTSDQVEYLRKQYPKCSVPLLTVAFNQTFGTALSEGRIRATLRRYRIQSGRTGRFEKGQTSWNLGMKGYMGPNATSFKPGQLPHNHKPLGSERVDKYGYVEMSVPERNPYTGFPTRYKYKHVWIWEQAHGPKPKGHAIIFVDGNRRNFEPDNLLLVTRSELLSLNLHGYKDSPDEVKQSVMALAKLEAKAGVRTRPARGRG
jgi:hypothetical protein